jgi:hypothetical protein
LPLLMVDTKLALLAAALALIDAIIPLSLGYASNQFSSLPSTPALLLLSGLVKLVLLLLPASFIKNPATVDNALTKKGSFCISDSLSAGRGDTPSPGRERADSPTRGHDQRSKGAQTPPNSGVCLDVQQLDKQHLSPSQKRQKSPTPDSTASQGGASDWHWPMLFGSAVCSTVAANISLSLIPEAAPFAWSQLALLQVIAAAFLTLGVFNSSSKGNKPGLSPMAVSALAVLFLAVLVGQGVFGGQPESLTAEPETESILQVTQQATAAAQLPPLHLVGWSLLAACLSTVGMRLLLAARHTNRSSSSSSSSLQPSSQQELCVVQCILAVFCNFVWYIIKEGSLDSFFDDITSSHEHAILLLGVSGLLSTYIACWPASDAVAASAYAHQASVVLAAWGSGLVLGMPQDGQFACASFAAGMAVLLLHLGMQPELQGGQIKAHHSADMQAWLHGEMKERRFSLRDLRNTLSYSWAVITLALVLVVCWGQFLHEDHTFSFSHPLSAPAMERIGITPADLMACKDTPFPSAQLYHSSIIAAERAVSEAAALDAALTAADNTTAAAAAHATPTVTAPNSTATAVQHVTANVTAPSPYTPAAAPLAAIPSPAVLAKAAAAPAPAWDLCPALTCSRDATCTAHNTSCCAHLFLQMAAFWDAFMHSNGLENQYTVLFDTLTDALDKGMPAANTGVMHLGVSAQSLAVLERPCRKTKLWQHGYALFLQGSSWHLCAHAQHPHPLFRQHMHPRRHLTPEAAAGSVTLHVMWPYLGPTNNTRPLTAVESALASSSLGGKGRASSTWRLCSTGEVLSLGGSVYVSLEGLRLPRPLGAELSLTSGSWASPTAASPPVSRVRRIGCEKLVAELLAHLRV